MQRGVRELEKLMSKGEALTGKTAFYLYETFGFPLEMTLEEMQVVPGLAQSIKEEFMLEQTQHSADSRTGSEQKFKGGLADSSEEVTKLHTAHHLLLKALQTVLGDHVHQRGSNITAERLRIDFSHPDKVTPEQLKEVEQIVNQQINSALPVLQVMIPREQAEQLGAEMEFGQKYPDTVSVYFIGGTPDATGIPQGWFSAEFCGGPHIGNTADLATGNKTFKIIKEESSSAGVRRIKASLV